MRIERAGLFLIPLDVERGWYRYHTLFAEAIRHRLNQDAPEPAALLRQRAAAWYAEQPDTGTASAALDPLLAAHRDQRAPADLAFSKRELEVCCIPWALTDTMPGIISDTRGVVPWRISIIGCSIIGLSIIGIAFELAA